MARKTSAFMQADYLQNKQMIVMYAMLTDNYILNHQRYPFFVDRHVWQSEFYANVDYDPHQRRYVNTRPYPISKIGTGLHVAHWNRKLKVGRRLSSEKHPNGKPMWLEVSHWYNDFVEESGWHESLRWSWKHDAPFKRDVSTLNSLVSYRGHPLQLGAWRIMLPSEVRHFCRIQEQEWEQWYNDNAELILSQRA